MSLAYVSQPLPFWKHPTDVQFIPDADAWHHFYLPVVFTPLTHPMNVESSEKNVNFSISA